MYLERIEPYTQRVYKSPSYTGYTLKNYFRVYWTNSQNQLEPILPSGTCVPTINATLGGSPVITMIPAPNAYVDVGCTSTRSLNLTGTWTVASVLQESPVKYLHNITIFYKFSNFVMTFHNETPFGSVVPPSTSPYVSPHVSPYVSPEPTITQEEIYIPYCIVDPFYTLDNSNASALFEVIYYHDLQKAITYCNTLPNITRNIYIRENTLIFLNKSLILPFSYDNMSLVIHGQGSMILCDNCGTHTIRVDSTQQSITFKNISFINTNGFFDFGNEQLNTGTDLNGQTLKTQEIPNSISSSLKSFYMENVYFYNEIPLVKMNFYPRWRNMTVDVYADSITQLPSSLEFDHDTKYENPTKNQELYEEMKLFLEGTMINERNPSANPLNPYNSLYRPQLKTPS